MREVLVSTDTLGRFGNSLFGIANCIRLAQEGNYNILRFTNVKVNIYDRKTVFTKDTISIDADAKGNQKTKTIKRRSLGLYETTTLHEHVCLYRNIFHNHLKDLYSLNNDIDLKDGTILTMHIRSEDIFSPQMLEERGNRPPVKYTQPPFCFYKHIIENGNFSRILIITTKDRNNPVIERLLEYYKDRIQFQCDTLDNDYKTLINASNLVLSSSSFAYTAMLFNKKLKNMYVFKTKYFFNFNTDRYISFSGSKHTVDHLYHAEPDYIQDWDPNNNSLYDLIKNYPDHKLHYHKFTN